MTQKKKPAGKGKKPAPKKTAPAKPSAEPTADPTAEKPRVAHRAKKINKIIGDPDTLRAMEEAEAAEEAGFLADMEKKPALTKEAAEAAAGGINKNLKVAALQVHEAELKTFLEKRGVKLDDLLKVIPDAVQQIAEVYAQVLADDVSPEAYDRATQLEREKREELYELYMQQEKGIKVDRMKKAPEGLGDTLEDITKALGIKKAMDWFVKKTGQDCGCDKRKAYLNARFNYHVKTGLCMNKEQFERWADFRKSAKSTLSAAECTMIVDMHADLFDHKRHVPCTSCPRTWQQWISDINKVYKSYLIIDRTE